MAFSRPRAIQIGVGVVLFGVLVAFAGALFSRRVELFVVPAKWREFEAIRWELAKPIPEGEAERAAHSERCRDAGRVKS